MPKKHDERPSISIITPTYNSAVTVADCLKSVASQTYSPAEHIIIDGASTDNTIDIIRGSRFVTENVESITRTTTRTTHSLPITRVISEPDNGIYDAMNKGIALATGNVIGILNADDFYASDDVLATVAQVFEDQTVMSCYGDLEYVREIHNHGASGKGHDFKVVRYWKSGTFTPRSWYWGWMPPHPTFFVRREMYEKYGRFRLDLGSAADYELMLRLLLKEGIAYRYIPEVLIRMRCGGASNRSITARLKANRMDRRAWMINGLKPLPWTLLCKPMRKILQYTQKAP